MQLGVRTVFKARLKKKRADGTIVYHDNKIINFIIKKLNGRKR